MIMIKMTWQFEPYAAVLFVTAIISVCVAIFALRRKAQAPGQWAFTGGMIAVTIWAFTLAMEAVTVEQPVKILWSQIEYFGYPYAAPFIFLFMLEYTGHKPLGRLQLALFWAIPVVTTLLTWTNPLHHLVWSGFRPGNPALNLPDPPSPSPTPVTRG